jgi:hypothetical protein
MTVASKLGQLAGVTRLAGSIHLAGPIRLAGIVVVCAAVFGSVNVSAQPLVTGDLTIYYNFDSFTDHVMDGSGNGFNGKVKDSLPGADNMRNVTDEGLPLLTTGVISNDTTLTKRGAGSIKFTQSDQPLNDPVFLDMDGSVITANAPTKVPKTAMTVGAWLNIPEIHAPNTLGSGDDWNRDASIMQGASAGHATPHFQLQCNDVSTSDCGRIRLSIRNGDNPSENITNANLVGGVDVGNPYVNQNEIDSMGAAPETYPLNEWFHLAFTFDQAANGGAGHYAVYYNGVVIRSGPSNGPADPKEIGAWALRGPVDFYDGLGIGAVYDSGDRRLHGNMDEFYLFTRALTPAEIATLAMVDTSLAGDYNDDGTVNAADYTVWRDGGSPDSTQAGYDLWKANFGNSGSGGGASVPEPSTIGLLLVCMGIFAARLRK